MSRVAAQARPDRASPADLMQLATGAGAAAQVGAVLVLDALPDVAVASARLLLAERVSAVPRLRQRLYRAPPGCGRPYWADDPGFDPGAHVRQMRCPPPGDERALLDVAGSLISTPLPAGRPLWSAVFITGLADGCTGLVFVMNHVLADGVAGLALLRALHDVPPAAAPAATPSAAAVPAVPAGPADRDDAARFPLPSPRLRELAADAWAERARRLAHPVHGLRKLRQGVAELGGARPPRRVPRSSLNQPTGRRRRLDVVTADLAAVRELAHAHGGTVNDVVLAAVAGALRALLASRGEQLPEVTISVLVSARRSTDGGRLGNEVGVMPVTVPADGGAGAPGTVVRVARVAAITRERKTQNRGASGALIVPGFLLLARAGALRWFVNRQRLVQTFVTNLRGPQQPIAFAGAPVRAVIAIPATTGNVTLTFGVLSHAGALRITVLSDPDRVPDVRVLTDALRAALGAAARLRP